MSSTNRGSTRTSLDFYPTPSWCVHRLLEEVVLPGGAWLEPCAGNGAIIDAVRAMRSDVEWTAVEVQPHVGSHLHSRSQVTDVHLDDFFQLSDDLRRHRVVITNPPFSSAERFIRASLELADHVVMLLRLNFLASLKRAPLMREHPPDVYVLPNRPSFTGSGTDSIDYAWFHWPPGRRTDGRLKVLATTSKEDRGASSARHGPSREGNPCPHLIAGLTC